MAYSVLELIIDAWYLSGIVARQLETVDGQQVNDGLKLFNFLVSEKALEYRKIPYYSVYNFAGVIGQEKYFIPNLLEVDTFVFFIGTGAYPIRYAMNYEYRKRYFATPRTEGITSLPYSWTYQRSLGGIDLYIYFLPSQNFPLQIWGRFAFPTFGLFDDLSLAMEPFYLQYMRYDLAGELCRFYNVQFSAENKEHLISLDRQISEMSAYDLSMQKLSTLNRQYSINYAISNFGGWVP